MDDGQTYELILAVGGLILGALVAWLLTRSYYLKALADAERAKEELMKHVTHAVGGLANVKAAILAIDVASFGLKTEAGKKIAGALLATTLAVVQKAQAGSAAPLNPPTSSPPAL